MKGIKKGLHEMINMVLAHQIHHKAGQITHHLKWELKRKGKQGSVDQQKHQAGCWLVKLAKTWKLPGDRPAASHRPAPEEPFLNYKLGTHLSVTQRNQCTVECTHKTRNIWKPQEEGLTEGHLENIDTSTACAIVRLWFCSSITNDEKAERSHYFLGVILEKKMALSNNWKYKASE